MVRRPCDDLNAPTGGEKCVGKNQERISLIVDKRCEGDLDLAGITRLNEVHVDPDGGRCGGRFSRKGFSTCGIWID